MDGPDGAPAGGCRCRHSGLLPAQGASNCSELSGAEVLRISALGLYRAFINGVRVGNDLLTPGWTSYDKRLSYQTYDVGPLLRHGQNVIDIWLADGWYRSQMMWPQNPIFNTWGSEIAAIAELRRGAWRR